ncbi:nuclear poly(A) polymerase 3 isoform X2 [Mangifera indica]|uniref:nuclear poly(A) polymerase 3 isoform X2 n=1 Tax=Mangifera indica TaxID=29780 RepID=UPI001CFAD25E|nr:nuclear poly(A) polymerase 3 isoform X2 [Mangifera indica]
MAAYAYIDNQINFVDFRPLTPSSSGGPPSFDQVFLSYNPLLFVVPHFSVPLNPSLLIQMDEERSLSLLQLIANEGLVPAREEEEKRKSVIKKLKQIVLSWAKKVAWQRRLPKEQIAQTHATILTYGSYGLGVHGSESDIDALCVGPQFATMAEDFFIVLRNMLKSRSEVTEIHCVKDAKVPLMRFKFDGVLIDLPYAQLRVLSVPDDVDVLSPFFVRDIDETSWKSLSGVRANQRIIQLVPDLEKFQSVLRCVKLWAKRRGVYGNLNGFLGGVHLAILLAFVCQNFPKGSISALITNFFKTFAFWPWPTPVMLQDTMSPSGYPSETRSLMPISLPCSSHEYCHTNITRSTFYKIRAEFLRAHNLTRDILRPDFDWHTLFEPFPFSKKYARFVKVYLSASNHDDLGDWVGWVKSRFRGLLVKLEEVQGLCDPNPTEYADADAAEPNVVFYWGLQPGRTHFLDIESVQKDFWKNITNGYQGYIGRMKLSIVQASQLVRNSQFDSGSGKRTKACWKIIDYNLASVPTYSQHMPNYFVGYMAANEGTTKHPSGGG